MKINLKAIVVITMCFFVAASAVAQLAINTTGNEFSTVQSQAGTNGKTVPGVLDMCLNASGIAVPCSDVSALPSPIAVAPTSNSSLGITPVVSGSASSGVVLKASPGSLYDIYATCTAGCWLMIFNSITIPSNGATTAGVASGNMAECVPIAAGGVASISYNPSPPEVFSVGISAAISSTACATLTLSTVGFVHGRIK